ncbi:MAG: TerB family tellurite resistance protein [Pseudomonadota bacterium]
MFQQLMRVFQAPAPQRQPDVKLSVAVLLVEAARQDDQFEPEERSVIATMLTQKFDMTAEECAALLTAAVARSEQMVQIQGHTSELLDVMTEQERIGVIEMLWEVAYADGVLDPEEDLLIRKVAGLIAVTDRERVLARNRVMARLGITIL